MLSPVAMGSHGGLGRAGTGPDLDHRLPWLLGATLSRLGDQQGGCALRGEGWREGSAFQWGREAAQGRGGERKLRTRKRRE